MYDFTFRTSASEAERRNYQFKWPSKTYHEKKGLAGAKEEARGDQIAGFSY